MRDFNGGFMPSSSWSPTRCTCPARHVNTDATLRRNAVVPTAFALCLPLIDRRNIVNVAVAVAKTLRLATHSLVVVLRTKLKLNSQELQDSDECDANLINFSVRARARHKTLWTLVYDGRKEGLCTAENKFEPHIRRRIKNWREVIPTVPVAATSIYVNCFF